MLILLPPSEGKAAAPRRGAALDLDRLSLPALSGARTAVVDDLVKLSGDPALALTTLGLTPGLADEAARNELLRTAPTLPAAALYTGVLYDALGLASLTGPALARARKQLLIFSGLWGAVRPADRIPSYRCSIGVRLPTAGPLAAYWRAALPPVLDELAGDALVLDLRSSAYASTWTPRNGVTVRVLHGGKVVSHFNKATKGRIVRALVLAGARPRTPAALATALRELGYTVDARTPHELDVTVEAL
ncbi:peroxide stress protein YaaA [Dactylosporangium sp. NPDC049742]|uniref:YaaA family protein n=1 Tax=Dactylosporangium sp. NPDC049742 TaxID=3154737 RepID=UPI003438B776